MFKEIEKVTLQEEGIRADMILLAGERNEEVSNDYEIDDICCYTVETKAGVGIFTTDFIHEYLKKNQDEVKIKPFNSFKDASENLDDQYGPDVWSTSDFEYKTINKIYEIDTIGQYYYFASNEEIMITRDFQKIEKLINECKKYDEKFTVEVLISFEEAQLHAEEYIMKYYGTLEGELPFAIPTETIIDIETLEAFYNEF